MFQYFSIDRPKKSISSMRKKNKIEITKQFSIGSKFPVNMLDILNVTLKEIIGASPKKSRETRKDTCYEY